MKNLKPFPTSDSRIDIYSNAIAAKRDINFRNRLAPLFPAITTSFSAYDSHFNKNELELIVSDQSCAPSSADLQSLYSYQSKVIKSVRKKIDEAQVFKITSTCQHCTINSVNSMDHFLPKSTFPEFAVHPFNLLPSCTECNGYKSSTLVRGGIRRFLNLYLDSLPQEQYLFLHVTGSNYSNIEYEFKLRNNGKIDPDLFAIIENHYNDLKLLTRMRLKSVEYVTELINTITVRRANLALSEIVNEILLTTELNQQAYGINHFKYILERELVQNSVFFNSF